jgi:hypothetical protein
MLLSLFVAFLSPSNNHPLIIVHNKMTIANRHYRNCKKPLFQPSKRNRNGTNKEHRAEKHNRISLAWRFRQKWFHRRSNMIVLHFISHIEPQKSEKCALDGFFLVKA